MTMLPFLICCDIAGRTGIATGIPGSVPILSTVQFVRPDEEIERSLGRAAKWAISVADRADGTKTVVFVEEPIAFRTKWGRSNYKTSRLLLGLWASVVGAFEARGIRVQTTAISSTRAWFCGDGRIPAERAKQEVVRIATALGWAPRDDNQADAGSLWHYASHLFDPRIKSPSEHWDINNERARQSRSDQLVGNDGR